MAAQESALSPQVLRNLGDRSYDRRKVGSLEVERLMRRLQADGNTDMISRVIQQLAQEFTCSVNTNHRKGGLIGLAGTAIGLMDDTKDYLDLLVPAVLKCFADQESRVRYYACESMFNIVKVARGHILKYFDVVFIGLCKLFADVDLDVKNAAVFLDRLLKDIASESESFDVDRFIALLQDHMKGNNPWVRALLVGWITVLDRVPDIEMLDWLPDFLEGLFDMLSDGNREIRQQAYAALAGFLDAINRVKPEDFDKRVAFKPIIRVLARQCLCEEKFNRVTAVWWLHQFIKLGGQKLVTMYAQLLESVLHCISDPEPELREEAKATNLDLLTLVKATDVDFELSPLLQAITRELPSQHKYTRTAALKWISMLLEKCPDDMLSFIDEVLDALLNTLSDESDEVVKMNLEVLARICLNERQFMRVMNDIVRLFASHRRLLEARGSFVVRRLCVLLNAKSIYITFAQILDTVEDREFVGLMIEILNLILLTAEELSDFRDLLRNCAADGSSGTSESQAVFTTLYNCWCHNPVATFSLCLLAQAYDLGAAVVSTFAEFHVTVGMLMQVDKLVQLLESPVFLHLRLQLLEPERPTNANLLRSLYGLLMLLPQSRAFNTLRNRLMSTTSLHIALGSRQAFTASPARGATTGGGAMSSANADLLKRYTAVQAKHSAARQAARRSRSLIQPAGSATGAGAGAAAGSGAGQASGDASTGTPAAAATGAAGSRAGRAVSSAAPSGGGS